MGSINLNINQEAFEQHGVHAVVDEPLFEELIDEHTEDAPDLDVLIVPGFSWGDRSLAQRFNDIRSGNEILPPGSYSSSSSSIRLPASSDARRTSLHLVHEAKHFIDDVNGASRESEVFIKNKLRGSVALFGIGMIVGQVSHDKKLMTDSAKELFFSLPKTYLAAPHEVAARQFAADPEIQAKYGNIITYTDIN